MVYVRVLCGPPLGTEHRALSIRLREDVLKQKLLRCGEPCADFNLNGAHEATVFALQAVVMRDGEHPAAAGARPAADCMRVTSKQRTSSAALLPRALLLAFDHGGGGGG
jgi:hypothetical protein